MSGVVAIVSRDPARAAFGAAALGALDHVEGYVRESAEAGAVWAGACGDPRAVSLAAAPAPAGRDGGDGPAEAGPESATEVLAAFSGDLLNRRGLGRELGVPEAASPAAIAAAAYCRWGAGLFARFEGAFALVIHDVRSGLTLAGSDPCCVAPLYATALGGDVCVSSEAKAFLAHPRFRARLDRVALGEVLCFGQALGGRPLFEGVDALPHGGHFEIAAGAVAVVRHWDVRDTPAPTLRGPAYLDRLEAVVRELGAEAFAEPGVALPLTGGLDSRLFAAVAPADREVSALTFGAPTDHDCALAARVAAARGIAHRVLPLDPGYAGRFSAETVWLLEGRLNPVGNITGSLMDKLRPAPAFISGAGAAAGRHFGRSRMLVPDWAWDHAGDADFERYLATRVKQYGLPWDRLPGLVLGGAELRATAVRHRLDILATTRGRPAVDRQDLYIVQERERFGQTGLTIADFWVQARAPLLTRRWIEAMLAGVPSERIDDRARLRLLMRLDRRVAAVPWSLTHLSLPASARLVGALRLVGTVYRRPLVPLGSENGPAADVAAAPSAAAPSAGPGGVMSTLQHRLYRHGDNRDEWLRGPSRNLVEDVLLSPRVGDHGVFDPSAVRALVAEHMAGGSLASALGIILQVELWQRFFEDGDAPPVVRRR
jgi:hypothetical protein